MGLSQMQVAQQASISVMKRAMEVGQTQMDGVIQMGQESTKAIEQLINPHVGSNMDISL